MSWTLNYLILIFLNINPIFGSKLIAVSYITIEKLNPLSAIVVIIVSETIASAISFQFANFLRKLSYFRKRLSKISDKWVKRGSYAAFFVGQLFIGQLFIALLLGLIEDKKNSLLYFYVPMISSTLLYTVIYYFLSIHGINLIKNYASIFNQINTSKKLIVRFI